MTDESEQLRKAKNNPERMWKLLAEAGKLLTKGKQIDQSWATHIGNALQAAAGENEYADSAETLIRTLRVTRKAGRPEKVTIEEINELRQQPSMVQLRQFECYDEKTGEMTQLAEPPLLKKVQEVARKLGVSPKAVEAKITKHKKALGDYKDLYVDAKDWSRAVANLKKSGLASPTRAEIETELGRMAKEWEALHWLTP